MTADAVTTSSLDRATILGIVRDQLAEILEKSPDDIDEDVPFTDHGRRLAGPDRTGRGARRELSPRTSAGFHIDDEDLEGLLSVRDAVDYVAAKLQVA